MLNKVNETCHQDELWELLSLQGDAPQNNQLPLFSLFFNAADTLIGFLIQHKVLLLGRGEEELLLTKPSEKVLFPDKKKEMKLSIITQRAFYIVQLQPP